MTEYGRKSCKGIWSQVCGPGKKGAGVGEQLMASVTPLHAVPLSLAKDLRPVETVMGHHGAFLFSTL